MIKALLSILLFPLALMMQAQPSDVIWDPIGGGVNGTVISVMKGGGDTVVVVGEFTEAGGVPANNVALWNGSGYVALGSGVSGGITCAAMIGSDIYIGGSSLNTNYTDVAHWDGTQWLYSTAFDGNFPQIKAMLVHNDTLYAGGIVSGFMGSDDRVKRLDNGTWELVGSTLNNIIHCLGWHNGQIVVGGEFTALQDGGGTNLNHVAILSAGDWGPLGVGLTSTVKALQDVDGTLYASGDILNGGFYQFGLARFPEGGTTWELLMPDAVDYIELGSLNDAMFSTLEYDGSSLYAGGDFDMTIGTITGSHLARFNGEADDFTPFASFNAPVRSMAHNGVTELIVAGEFTQNGGDDVSHVAHTVLSTGVSDPKKQSFGFDLFPNPVTDHLGISLDGVSSKATTVEVLDLEGRSVAGPLEIQYGKGVIDVSHLPSGAYLVRANMNGRSITETFIKR